MDYYEVKLALIRPKNPIGPYMKVRSETIRKGLNNSDFPKMIGLGRFSIHTFLYIRLASQSPSVMFP